MKCKTKECNNKVFLFEYLFGNRYCSECSLILGQIDLFNDKKIKFLGRTKTGRVRLKYPNGNIRNYDYEKFIEEYKESEIRNLKYMSESIDSENLFF